MDINSEYWLKEAQRVAKIGIYIYDIKNNIWISSEILDDIFGIDADYPKNLQGWLDIIHYSNIIEMEDYLKDVIGTGKEFDKEYQIIRQNDKSVRWVLGKGKLYYDEQGFPDKLQGTIQDITELKSIKTILDENEQRYQQLFDISPAAITVHSGTTILFANDSAAKLFKANSKEELIGTSIHKIIPHSSCEKLCAESNVGHNQWIGIKIDGFDGNEIDVEVMRMQFTYQDQKAIQIVYNDITKRKLAEEMLRSSEESYKNLYAEFQQKQALLVSLINSIPDLIFYKNSDSVYMGCNKAFEAFANLKEEELTGLTDLDMFSKDVADFFRAMDLEMMSRGEPRRNEELVQYPDGKQVLLDTLKTPFYDQEGNVLGLIGISRDITERKRNEEKLNEALERLKVTQSQLIQQEKLAGIGQLAAGVAHEINNPLGYVISNFVTLNKFLFKYKETIDSYRDLKKCIVDKDDNDIEAKLKSVAEVELKNKIDFITEDLKDLLCDTNNGLDRISKIVTGLRNFSHVNRQEDFVEYDLNAGIKDTLVVAHNEIKYFAKVEDYLGEMPTIYANGGQINQVLLNIIINALHAIKLKEMDAPGLIKITTSTDDQYAYCFIEDNGIGISSEHINRIFEPFFTTKEIGKGTGLGLSISHDIIVNKHKGELMVKSELGLGTEFTIKLPIHGIKNN